MHLVEMVQLTLDDVIRHTLHRFGDVGEEPGFFAIIEQIEQGTGLTIFIITLLYITVFIVISTA
jgi:hypothetical protein